MYLFNPLIIFPDAAHLLLRHAFSHHFQSIIFKAQMKSIKHQLFGGEQ